MAASLFKSLFGGSSPKVQTTAVQEIEKEDDRSKKARQALYSTSGGEMGEELGEAGKARQTFFGN